MPPRYAYWTILVDEQPTAFRSSMPDELEPTFRRLKQKHPSARMVWFQNGKVWSSRLEAQEAMRMRGERGRHGDFRQRQRDRKEGKLEWRPKQGTPPTQDTPRAKLEWQPKSTNKERPKLEWTPKGAAGTSTRPQRPKPSGPPRERRDRSWRPGGEHKDPRQKYKDAKKAKWTRFKQTIRKRWETKQPRKKKDDE